MVYCCFFYPDFIVLYQCPNVLYLFQDNQRDSDKIKQQQIRKQELKCLNYTKIQHFKTYTIQYFYFTLHKNYLMSYISRVLSGKCPNCGKEDLFYDKGNPITMRMPKMTKECSHCHYNFHRETGFYFGGMYVSYGLTVAEMCVVMVLRLIINALFDVHITLLQTFIAIVVVLLLCWTFNYRLSRIIWLNIFYKKE